tara:strand:+ start:104 stop:652 length:549 start_codon:yes stop_codon:yes gene_type:complete
MPNWCENIMKVRADDKGYEQLKQFAKDHDMLDKEGKIVGEVKNLFNKLVKMPEEYKGISTGGTFINGKKVKAWRTIDGEDVAVTQSELDSFVEKYGSRDWYEWACSNWGTKWDVDARIYELDENYLELEFETAWSPPVQWLVHIAKKYPKLSFRIRFEEEGMGFFGIARGDDGEVIAESLES